MTKQLLSNSSNDISSVKYEIDRFLLGDEFDLIEGGVPFGPVGPRCSAAEVSYGKVIFSCWGDGWSRSWKVLDVEVKSNGLDLQCSKQLGLKTLLLELRRGPEDVEVSQSRREFADWIVELIQRRMADVSVDSAIVARVDRRHLSGNYVRLVLRQGTGATAKRMGAIAASSEESQPVIDSVLAAGIVWLDDLRKRTPEARHLVVLAPNGRASTIATRMTTIDRTILPVSLYEFDGKDETLQATEAFDQGDLADNFKKAARNAVWPVDAGFDREVRELVGLVVGIAPDFIDFRRRGQSVVFSIRGLDFAMVSIRQRAVYFGLDHRWQRLTELSRPQLEHLVSEIIDNRSPRPDDRGSEYYRAYSERWLESILRRKATLIDPDIDSRHVYSQVPTYRGEQRTFMDLLTVTRGGRLVIMELKVTEDRDFPLQAIDYWLRVEWHRSRGDFHKRGYFSGIQIEPLPPLLYLVAPLFSFHATTSLVAASISDNIPLYRIGINNDWRSGVRVLLREKLN
ncbi:MAG: hypothetical protein ACREDR_21885 [Blastocatellia bacterium]